MPNDTDKQPARTVWLALADAAQHLRVTYQVAYQYVLTGRLVSRRRKNRRIQVTRASVERLHTERANGG